MTIRALMRHRNAVVAFHNAYIEYIGEGPSANLVRRARVVELIPAAQAGMNAAGVYPMLYPPLAAPGPVLKGLANLAFAHEAPGFGMTPIAPRVLDWCQLAGAQLDESIARMRRRRRNPLHWIDALLRTLLGIPAYLLGLILRVPAERIDASPIAGTALRMLSATSQFFAVYLGGQEAGWW